MLAHQHCSSQCTTVVLSSVQLVDVKGLLLGHPIGIEKICNMLLWRIMAFKVRFLKFRISAAEHEELSNINTICSPLVLQNQNISHWNDSSVKNVLSEIYQELPSREMCNFWAEEHRYNSFVCITWMKSKTIVRLFSEVGPISFSTKFIRVMLFISINSSSLLYRLTSITWRASAT